MSIKPLKRLRNSISGNLGPGIDSNPGSPDRNPALAAEPKAQTISSIMDLHLVTQIFSQKDSKSKFLL